MKYDFDKVIDRHGTDCYKYDFAEEFGIPSENLSLWVADMDFPTSSEVIEEIKKAADFGIFGYTSARDAYYQAVINWYKKHFDWEAKRDWIVPTPGVVFALATAVRSFTEAGDHVVIQRPVYYPFSNVIENNGRVIENSPLVLRNGRYEIDFEDLEAKLAKAESKMFILCSPHNPVSRAWSGDELVRIGELCLKHGVILVSDEIHSDFVWGERRHHVMASLDDRFLENVVVCTAPSKTFNLAGLQASNVFIPNSELRGKYLDTMDRTGYGMLNIFGLVACRAAYEKGEEWLSQVKEYIVGNIEFVREYLERELPEIKLVETEATYLLWLDMRALGLSGEELDDLIINRAHLWLDGGTMFGPEGAGFQRVNVACSRSYLQKAMEQLKAAIDE